MFLFPFFLAPVNSETPSIFSRRRTSAFLLPLPSRVRPSFCCRRSASSVLLPCKLLFKLNRPFEVAARGYSFIISFSKALSLHESILPFCRREVWVITACLALINATSSEYNDGLVAADVEKEFYRVQGDLYSLCRVKFMRLAYLVGYGTDIEKSPSNSASLSMLPWPKPAVWPAIPPDASSEVLQKEKAISGVGEVIQFYDYDRPFAPWGFGGRLQDRNGTRMGNPFLTSKDLNSISIVWSSKENKIKDK